MNHEAHFVFHRPVNNIVRIAVPKKSDEVPVSASLLVHRKTLDVKHSDMGLDRDTNTYYDILLPNDFQSEQAFVIKMQLGSPKSLSEKLMDAKM